MVIFDPNFDYEFFDESAPEQENDTPALDTGLGVLIAGFSGRGKKNKIIENRSPSALKTEYGDDFGSFEKYGQANIHALRLAKSKARVFFCSLSPDDAKVAYSVFGVSLVKDSAIPVYRRTDTVISEDGTTVLSYGSGAYVLDGEGNKIQITVRSTENGEQTIPVTVSGVILKTETIELTNRGYFDNDGNPTGFDGSVQTLLDANNNERKFYPLFTTYYYSRGKGGNDFAFHIARQTSRDKKSVDGRRYVMYFYQLSSTGKYTPLFSGEDFNFSFNKDAVFSPSDNTSEALGNVYKNIDDNNQTKLIQLIAYPESYDALIKEINDSGANEEDSAYDIDILNAIFKNGNPYNKIVVADDSIDIENSYITLDHGTDGSIEVGNTLDDGTVVTEEMARAKKEELLINFFNCDVDDDIFDEKITDIDILPDENYPDEVKKTILSKFSLYRPDIALPIDFGIEGGRTSGDAISKCRELSTYVNSKWSFMVSFYGHSGLLKDKEIDGTPRLVTATYDWAAGLADDFAKVGGAFQMRAGANHGRVTYFNPFWVAVKNKANTIATLEELHINNIQYLNKNKDLVYGLEDTQYEVENSKMMSVRNAIVVGRIIRIVAGVTPYYKYDENEIATTMVNCKKDLDDRTAEAAIPKTIKIDFQLYQTKLDVKEDNAHIGVDITFPNYAKKFHLELRAKRPTNNIVGD